MLGMHTVVIEVSDLEKLLALIKELSSGMSSKEFYDMLDKNRVDEIYYNLKALITNYNVVKEALNG